MSVRSRFRAQFSRRASAPRSRAWESSSSSLSFATQEPRCYLDPRFNPTYEMHYNTDVLWQIPESPRGVMYLAHGRFLDIFSFFDRSPGCERCYGLPEDRAIVLDALDRKYAVIVVKSLGDEWDSWPIETSKDKVVVTSIVTDWVMEHGLDELPMVGFGYSSGGNFTSMLSPILGMKSIVILDSPGVYEILENADASYPPTLYFYMPKDPFFTSQILRNVELMKSRGVKVEHVPMLEFPIILEFFALRNPCISNETSRSIFRALLNAKLLDENNLVTISPWEFDYNSWIEENDLLSGCIPHTCLSEQVVQELNIAFAFHSMSSTKNDIMFDWFESSLESEVVNPMLSNV